jgi:hypothetical protein
MGEFSCDVVSVARQIRNHLCGAEPEPGIDKGQNPGPRALITEMNQRADYLASQLATTLSILNQIASRVGAPPLNATPPSSKPYPSLARG